MLDQTLFTLVADVTAYPQRGYVYDDDDDTPGTVIPAGTKVILRLTYHGRSQGTPPAEWNFDAIVPGTPGVARVVGSEIREDVEDVWWCDDHYAATDCEGYPTAKACGAPRYVINDVTGDQECENGCYFHPIRNAADERAAYLMERYG